jgi:NADH-quinone oxidoreductase subunit L
VGLGAYAAAMFHVITHAFFKACMFLGSGTVIHALHGEQDMRKMGGLKGPLATTFWPFAVSTLAIAGFPATSGFFSKDLILGHAFLENKALFAVGLLGAAMTAFYMGRLVMLTFFGKLRDPDPHAAEHLHLPGPAMVVPVVILGVLAVVGGGLNLPHLLPFHGVLESWLEPVLGSGQALKIPVATELMLWAASAAVGIGGLAVAYFVYRDGPSVALEGAVRAGPGRIAHLVLLNKWYVDEIYDATVVRGTRFLGSLAAMIFDPWIIDGILVKLLPGLAVKTTGAVLRKPQSGNVQAYATLFVVAAAVITTWAVWK